MKASQETTDLHLVFFPMTESKPKASESKASESKASESKASESKASESKPKPMTESKASESKASESIPNTAPQPEPKPKHLDMESLKAKWQSVKGDNDSVRKLKEYKRIYQQHEAMVNPEKAEIILADNNELVRENKTMTADSRMNYKPEILDLKTRDSISLDAYPEKLNFNPRNTFIKEDGNFKNSGRDRSSFDLIMENTKLFRIIESISLDNDSREYLAPLLEGIEPEEIETFASMGTINDKLKDKLYKNLITFAVKVTNEGTVNDYGLKDLINNEKTKIQVGLQKPTEQGKRSPVCDARYLEKWYQYVKDLLDITKKYASEEKDFIEMLDKLQLEMLKSRIYVKYSRWDRKLVMDYETELEGIFGKRRPLRKVGGKNYISKLEAEYEEQKAELEAQKAKTEELKRQYAELQKKMQEKK